MILLGSIVLVVLGIVPQPWGVVLIGVAAVVEVAESVFWYRLSRRRRPVVGREALIGEVARVIQPCRPEGQVRFQGEIWMAHCEDGADTDQTVRVRAVKGLQLVVERVE